DGIRDFHVTGVQTCALPISGRAGSASAPQWLQPSSSSRAAWLWGSALSRRFVFVAVFMNSTVLIRNLQSVRRRSAEVRVAHRPQIGRASCREAVQSAVGAKL